MLALAALSARWLAGWAAADGSPALVLDVFGDADTRAAAREWRDIGVGGAPPRIDGARLLAELRALADRSDIEAFVAGSGFESDPDLLEQAARIVPLAGTLPADQRRVADAPAFFAWLDAHAIAHPPVVFDPPRGAGWLRKRLRSSGGFGVSREAARGPRTDRTAREPCGELTGREPRGELTGPEPCGELTGREPRAELTGPDPRAELTGRAPRAGGVYWQRERPGPAYSATFVANGEAAVVLGLNRQACAAIDGRPFVFAGVCGPVVLPGRVLREIGRALALLAPAYRLCGLGSVDFMLGVDDSPEIIEVNPRPSASAALYPRLDGASPLRAHLRACRDGVLPAAAPSAPARALRIVYARRPLQLGDAGAACIAAAPGAHDLPAPGARFGAGAPLCTLEAEGADPTALDAALVREASQLLDTVEDIE